MDPNATWAVRPRSNDYWATYGSLLLLSSAPPEIMESLGRHCYYLQDSNSSTQSRYGLFVPQAVIPQNKTLLLGPAKIAYFLRPSLLSCEIPIRRHRLSPDAAVRNRCITYYSLLNKLDQTHGRSETNMCRCSPGLPLSDKPFISPTSLTLYALRCA
jgi:hypothetical protein